jgi:exodeoxyribonuclease-3
MSISRVVRLGHAAGPPLPQRAETPDDAAVSGQGVAGLRPGRGQGAACVPAPPLVKLNPAKEEKRVKIATFNINGIKARIDQLTGWLQAQSPDVALLQEIKSQDEGFPREIFEDMGYRVETHGQKSFNGVAILSKLPLEDVTRGLPGDDGDEQARWIEATVMGARAVRVCGLYLPNGNPAPGPKYDYKLAWMERLEARARALLTAEEPAVMAGDYNVIPQDEDAARPEAWRTDALALPDSRAAFRRILNLGFTDAFRARTRAPGHYSFWDYQAGAWNRNDGIRIDHVLLTPQAADLLQDCWIEREMRGQDKPSDHVPVWVDLDA